MTKKSGKKKFSVVSNEKGSEPNLVTVFVLKNVLGYRYGAVARLEDSGFIRDNIRAGNLRLVEESAPSVPAPIAAPVEVDEEPAIVDPVVEVDDGGVDADV